MRVEKKGVSPKTPQRLKRKDLVMGVLYRFSEVFETSQAESILDISIPIQEIRAHLKERFGVEYSSNQWVYTQLRRYEDEIGAKLFDKTTMKDSNFFDLILYPEMLEFVQKQHLHVPQKIKIANGVYDKIISASEDTNRNIDVLLGAGSTMYHLSNILIERQYRNDHTFTIYTHNAGIIAMLFYQQVDHNRLSVVTAGGALEPVTRTILGDKNRIFEKKEFDFIIQGTSLIHEGNLYIESKSEQIIKSEILHGFRGCKILVLTKHEFQDEPIPKIESYGKVSDYDYVIVPRTMKQNYQKKYELRFEQYYNELFEPEILNWNYCILKVK